MFDVCVWETEGSKNVESSLVHKLRRLCRIIDIESHKGLRQISHGRRDCYSLDEPLPDLFIDGFAVRIDFEGKTGPSNGSEIF